MTMHKMTEDVKLDEAALKAACQAYEAEFPDVWYVTFDGLRAGIRAYLAALPPAQEPVEAMVETILDGSAPMSKWVGSVDYHDLGGFEEYLKAQLRDKLMLKISLDEKRAESPEDESLATFVDGATGALESALATFRFVRASLASSSSPAGGEPERAIGFLDGSQINIMHETGHVAEIWPKRRTADDIPVFLRADDDEARRYLERLLVSFVNKHCDPIPEWRPLPDLIGMLTQLDNALSRRPNGYAEGLEAAAKVAEAEETLYFDDPYGHEFATVRKMHARCIAASIRALSPIQEKTEGRAALEPSP